MREISNHLRFAEHITAKDYYDTYLKKPGDGICPCCGKPTKFDCLEKGYKHHCSLKCSNSDITVQQKQQNTTMKNYGVLHPAQNKKVLEKMKSTCVEKYGAENGHGEEQKQKIKENCLRKYGVESSFQREDVIQKSKQTKIERYGQEDFTNRSKCKETMQQKYGVSNCSQLPDHLLKVSETKTQRYGSSTYNNSTKMLKTKASRRDNFEKENDCVSVKKLIKLYGAGWTQTPFYKTIIIKHEANCYVKNADVQQIIDYVETVGSRFEKDVYEYVTSIYSGEVIRRTRKVIAPQELDIFIPEKNIAIECNGSYWHSSEHGVPKNYHITKSKLCKEQGLRLIHIYEWEWVNNQDKIKQLLNIALGTVSRIYARQCEVREISNQEAKPFNEATHLQGHRTAQVTYGLFYNNELVQLMSFSQTRYNRNLKNDNEWEIIRGCPGSNNIVVGGVSKLFKHFVREKQPSKVFSYCDFNKFDGKSYLTLGMSFEGYTGPNKWWLLPTGNAIPRNPRKYMELKGNNTVWGSGSLRFVWNS